MPEQIRSYHARRGRLSPNQRQALIDHADLDLATHPDPLDLDATFGRIAPRTLEIGSGLGDAVLELASTNPDHDYIAADVHTKGIARTLLQIEARKLPNVRVVHCDALAFLDRLPATSLREILVWFPDPWPKARHNKRRFVSPETLAQFHRILVPEGLFLFASDISDYVAWTRQHVADHSGFAEEGDPNEPYENWIETRYEAKARREGRGSNYLRFRRR